MKTFRFLQLASNLILLFFIFSCATSKEADEYTKSYVDQSLVLPENVRRLSGSLFSGYTEYDSQKNKANESYSEINFLSLGYGQTENLTIFLMPLPLIFKYRYLKTENIEIAATVGLTMFGYSSLYGWKSKSLIRNDFKYNLDEKNMVVFGLHSFSSFYDSRYTAENYDNYGVNLDYYHQLSPELAVGSTIGSSYSEYYRSTQMPVGILGYYSIDQNWRLNTELQYISKDYESDKQYNLYLGIDYIF